MRDEKEGRKKQARSYKQQGKATQHTQSSHFPKNQLDVISMYYKYEYGLGGCRYNLDLYLCIYIPLIVIGIDWM